mgnify:CR=1 FL=1
MTSRIGPHFVVRLKCSAPHPIGTARTRADATGSDTTDQPEHRNEARTAEPCVVPQQRGRGTMANILVIDDDVAICRLLTDVLEIDQHEVRVAMDGNEGVRAFDVLRPDFVVLDVMMPGLDGHGVLRTIRDRPGNAVPVLMLTASADAQSAQQAWAQGANYYLAKPFTADDVVHAIDTAIRVTSGAALAPETSAEAEPYLQAGIAAYKAGRIEEAIRELQAGVHEPQCPADGRTAGRAPETSTCAAHAKTPSGCPEGVFVRCGWGRGRTGDLSLWCACSGHPCRIRTQRDERP